MADLLNLVYGGFSRNRGPPLEILLTQFRKFQPSPLEVGDHLIVWIMGQKSQYDAFFSFS